MQTFGEMYDQMLDECYGMVEVGCINEPYSDLLKQVDPIAYRVGFCDWSSEECHCDTCGESLDVDEDDDYYTTCEDCEAKESYESDPDFIYCQDCGERIYIEYEEAHDQDWINEHWDTSRCEDCLEEANEETLMELTP